MSKTTTRKALFVTPDLQPAGAEKSLFETLRCLDGMAVDLMLPFWCHGGNEPKVRSILREQNIHNVHSIFFRPLPKQWCYQGAPSGAKALFKQRIKRALWTAYRKKFETFVLNKRYAFVHLNSICLYPMLSTKLPCIQHIREVVAAPTPDMQRFLAAAAGAIFSDNATKNCFKDTTLPRHCILNNPFDMTPVAAIDPQSVLDRLHLSPLHTIFSAIGSLLPVNGVDRIINAFKNCPSKHSRLLIAGKLTKDPYVLLCQALAEGDPRIRFLDEEQNIEEIYAITDYAVCGKATFALDRTFFEATYAGCDALIPGTYQNLAQTTELVPCKSNIYTYNPENSAELTRWFNKLSGNKVRRRRYLSTFPEYKEKFLGFIDATISPGPS